MWHRTQIARARTAFGAGCGQLLLTVALVLGAAPALADIFTHKFTSNGLGLGTSDINGGSTVDVDVAGKLITSALAGQGSILTIQKSGAAGPGSVSDPLMTTVTANTHLDTTSGLPAGNDYQAGVLFISNESGKAPDGRDEGMGVRAFTVTGATGVRQLGSNGRARIEGSNDVSGGTGPSAYDSAGPNGAPHVDESVTFTFNTAFNVAAQSVEVLLSKFEASDVIDLHIERAVGGPIDETFLGTSNTSVFEQVGSSGDHVWKVKFSGLASLLVTDVVKSFSIRAVDDNPSKPSGTAEHFLIAALTADATAIPEPGAILFGGAVIAVVGVGAVGRRAISKWRARGRVSLGRAGPNLRNTHS